MTNILIFEFMEADKKKERFLSYAQQIKDLGFRVFYSSRSLDKAPFHYVRMEIAFVFLQNINTALILVMAFC